MQYANIFTWEKSTALFKSRILVIPYLLKWLQQQNSLWMENKKTDSSLHPWDTFLG